MYSGLKSNHELPSDHEWHMIHCFSYLRQAIMCSADMALEGHETTFPDHNGGSDGWDSKHGEFRCPAIFPLLEADSVIQCVGIMTRSSPTWSLCAPTMTG